MTRAELEAAWDLWFELAQHTNDFDEPYTHGVFQGVQLVPMGTAGADGSDQPSRGAAADGRGSDAD